MNSLSLCMIVRDEAELLPQFLERAAGLWDELIVVDTGSVDATRQIAEAAGARVFEEPWREDFAAARNVGLDAATGDWILILDADEMMTPTAAAGIRKCLCDPQAGAAKVLMRNYLPHGHKRDTHLLRLFRAHPSIRFRYPIHETVADAVDAFLGETGLCMRHLAGEIKHLGYVRDRAAARNKKDRDLQILLRCTLRDPSDFYSWFKILELARFWDDERLGCMVASRVGTALEASNVNLATTTYGGQFVALVADRAFDNKQDALDFMDRFEARILPSAEFLMCRGELKESLGDGDGARRDFEACLSLDQATSNEQMASVRPRLGLARLQIAAGELTAADQNVRRALEHNPRDPEALFAAVALRARSAVSNHVELFDELSAEHGKTPELHAALAEMALLQGRAWLAVEHFKMAAGTPPRGRPGLRLAQAMLASGDSVGARSLAADLIAQLPEAAVGIMVADLVEGQNSDVAIDLEIEEANVALRAWVDTAICARHPEVVGSLRAYAHAVASIFPWLPTYLEVA